MSNLVVNEDRKKRRAVMMRPASRAVNMSGIHGVNQSTRRRNSVVVSPSRRRFSLGGGSKALLEKNSVQTVRQAARVFDEDDNDVTPQPLYQADTGAVKAKANRFFVDEISAGSTSDQTVSTASFALPFSRSLLGSSRISSQSTIESINEEIEDTLFKRDMLISCPDVQGSRDTVKEQVTEEMLEEVIDIYISETDSISLLDIPSICVSVNADDAEAVTERNSQYVEMCRNRMGNDKYVDRSIQTLNGAAKNKHVQSNSMMMVDTDTTVTAWDMYDTLCSAEHNETVHSLGPEKVDCPEVVVDTSRCTEMSMSVGSTVSSASAVSSLKELDVFGNRLNAEADLQTIMLSEKFKRSLQVMERNILGNNLQLKLATFRQLSALEADKGVIDSLIQDLLAVGYGDFDSSYQKPGLVCCWSFKNPMWPERVIHCHSAVTSLDFSGDNPSHLAVGTYDGNVAIYNVSQETMSCICDSSECSNKHLGPVWQLKWTQQDLSVTGQETGEALISVSADGRINRWFVFNNGLDCIELMKLKRIRSTKKMPEGNNAEKKTESLLGTLTPGLCFDFHPLDSSLYLVGTFEGLIHKCSSSNHQQFLETYRKHFCPVSCIAWCPLSPNVFLSCSSDWTIQLWKQDSHKPVLGFISTQTAVCDIKWSPKCATVFGAVNEKQLEIWDLNISMLDPILVQPPASGVRMKTMLFATQTNCVLVGDSNGQVNVYQLRNLSVGDDTQVDILEGILSAASFTS